MALKSTSGEKRKKIRRAIDNLSAGGSTHGSAGIVMAYDQAMEHFVKEGTNRVILCTDGDLNVGITDDNELVKLIGQQATSGCLSDRARFRYRQPEGLQDGEAGRQGQRNLCLRRRPPRSPASAGRTDCRQPGDYCQGRQGPDRVQPGRGQELPADRLRETRIMAAKDFANDKKDAGEIGAGHTVTALYEIVPGDGESGGELGRELKYQRKTGRELTEAASSGELFTLKLRYKEPEGKKSKLLEFVQKDSDKPFGQASADFRFASSVAGFGMLLRGSQYAGDLNWVGRGRVRRRLLGRRPRRLSQRVPRTDSSRRRTPLSLTGSPGFLASPAIADPSITPQRKQGTLTVATRSFVHSFLKLRYFAAWLSRAELSGRACARLWRANLTFRGAIPR